MPSTECGGSPLNLASFQVWFMAAGFAHAAISTMANATRSAAHLTSIPGWSLASMPVHRTVGEPICEPFEPEAEHDHQDADHDREGTDPPDQRERPGPGRDDQERTEQDRQGPARGEEPLVLELTPQMDGGDDLEDAPGDGPRGDQVQQRDRGDARPEEGQDADRDGGEPRQERAPRERPFAALDEGPEHGHDAVGQRVGAVERYENEEREAGPEEGAQAEEQREHAAKQDGPPVLRQSLQHRRALRRSVVVPELCSLTS